MCASDGSRVCVSDDCTAEFQLSHETEVSHIDHKQLKIGHHLGGSIWIRYRNASLQFIVDVICQIIGRSAKYVVNIALIGIHQLLGEVDHTGPIILKPEILRDPASIEAALFLEVQHLILKCDHGLHGEHMQRIEVHGIVERIIAGCGVVPGQLGDQVGSDVGDDATGDDANEGDVEEAVERDRVVLGEDCEDVDR